MSSLKLATDVLPFWFIATLSILQPLNVNYLIVRFRIATICDDSFPDSVELVFRDPFITALSLIGVLELGSKDHLPRPSEKVQAPSIETRLAPLTSGGNMKSTDTF